MSEPHSTNLLHDAALQAAIGRLFPRSERAPDPEKLAATFVDKGIIDLVDNPNNQVIYGRRGTGKTHVLGVLESRFRARPNTAVTNIDLRTLGSSTLFTDVGRPLHSRFIGLYKDIISILHNELFMYAMEHPETDVDAALVALDEVERQMNYAESETEARKTVATETHGDATRSGVEAGIGQGGLSLSATIGGESSATKHTEIQSERELSPKLVFPALHGAFDKTTRALHLARFVILIDEWSSIPPDLQPFFAELLNRVFFANRNVTIKIASLEFRSSFILTDPNGMKVVGLELGGDIETAVDLDDFYVYDRDPTGTEALFADLLLRHLVAALDDASYLGERFDITTGDGLTAELFTEQAFTELVRTAEGVARDFLQIFTRAYRYALRTGSAHITVPTVTAAAREWYESDKQTNLGEEQHELLRNLIEQVIGDRHARSFMVAREDSSAPLLRSLIDQRVVHVIRKGYADKDNPGIRYNIYTLDYGCYVDLKGTKREPTFELEEGEGDDIIVPFDDRRRIRRIIVSHEMLFPAASDG
jgi:hypothetical protein